MRIIRAEAVDELLSLEKLLPLCRDALISQAQGTVTRPERPHYPIGQGIHGNEPLGTGLAMPAYIHGEPYAVTKLATVHDGNTNRGLPTVQATIAVTDAETGTPLGYLDGRTITNARTGCIGGLAARQFTDGPITVGVLGAGTQARWQTRAIATACPVEQVHIYSPSDSKHTCADELRSEGIDAVAVETSDAAVSDVDVIVTATTATAPTFDGSLLRDDAVVIAVGAYTSTMQELDRETIERATAHYADVPEEAIETGDIPSEYAAHIQPLGRELESKPSTRSGIVVVKSVGTAVLDAAAAGFVYDAAESADRGTVVPF